MWTVVRFLPCLEGPRADFLQRVGARAFSESAGGRFRFFEPYNLAKQAGQGQGGAEENRSRHAEVS